MPPASPMNFILKRASRILITVTAAGLLPLYPHFSISAHAGQSTDLSLQGFSGILNTPTGHVQKEGSLGLLYSNQQDKFKRGTPPWQDNYLLSVGMFSFAEICGRLTAPNNIKGAAGSDLSANAKISSAPFTAHLPFAPAVALGIQDMGGGASTTVFRSTYLAASADPLPWMRLSAGYGLGPDRMNGVFGGVELQPHERVRLLGEYDTVNTSAGVRLTAPPLPWLPASLTLTAKSTLSRSSRLDIAFGLTIPLDMKRGESAMDGARFNVKSSDTPDQRILFPETDSRNPEPATRESQLSSIRSRLIAAGFANVRVGVMDDKALVVEYENVRYNHNELDAIGVVAGVGSSADIGGIDSLNLVVMRKGLRMLLVSSPLREMRNWLADTGDARAPSIKVESDTSSVERARFIDGESNPDWLRPSLILYPGLKTFAGTEVGVFDYLLSIKPDLQVTTWKGGVLNARWDLPVAWSNNFDDNRQFAYARNKPMMDRLMLFQGITLAPGLMANLGGGMILNNINGTLNELVWSPQSGMHRFRVAQAYARNSSSRKDITVWLGSYRMYIAAMDLFLEGTAGRFWGQDTGGLLALKRFFGDTAVDLYYKNTETPEKKRWQAAGISFSFPLTPRRDMKRAPLQLRGTEEWGYGQETVLAINGQKTNDTISAGLGVNPLPSPAIYRSYLNRDRLNEDYIQAHKLRVKEAWRTFSDNLPDALPKF